MRLLFTIAFFLALQISNGQQINLTKERITQLDSIVKAEMNAREVPGLAYGICLGNQLVHMESFGYADLQN